MTIEKEKLLESIKDAFEDNRISYGNGVFVAVGGNFGHIAYTNKQEYNKINYHSVRAYVA
jgi:predicted negative regulator of RcsB-dependent stress response